MENVMAIKTQKLAGFLMCEGFVLKKLEKDFGSKRNIFLFNKSDEIREKIKEYSNANELTIKK